MKFHRYPEIHLFFDATKNSLKVYEDIEIIKINGKSIIYDQIYFYGVDISCKQTVCVMYQIDHMLWYRFQNIFLYSG